MTDRFILDDDVKKLVIDLSESKFIAPNVGLTDEPVRYYMANEQWASIFEGLLNWLTEITAWADAQDENHPAIQATLEFIEGVQMAIDCQAVEDCIETSPTIININNEITTIEGDITNVTNTVNNHTTEITNLTENVTEITENTTYNEYPEYPDPSENLTDFCGSAWRIANYLNDFLQDVIIDQQTLTFLEFFESLVFAGGFKASPLKLLWDTLIANIYAGLATEISDSVEEVAQAFFCNQLSSSGAIADIENSATMTQGAIDSYVSLINSLTLAKFNELIYLGSLDDSQDCGSFACECSEYDFTKGLHGWTAVTNTQIAGKGLRATNSTGGRFEFIVMSHFFNVTKIEVDWLKEGSFSSFRDIDLFYYSNGSQFGQTLMAPNISLSSDTIVVNVNAPNCNGLRWFIRDSGSGQSGALYVQRLRIYGTPVTGRPQNSAPSC